MLVYAGGYMLFHPQRLLRRAGAAFRGQSGLPSSKLRQSTSALRQGLMGIQVRVLLSTRYAHLKCDVLVRHTCIVVVCTRQHLSK